MINIQEGLIKVIAVSICKDAGLPCAKNGSIKSK